MLVNSGLKKWPRVSLGEVMMLSTQTCSPAATPNQLYVHHSIPAWDEFGGPVREAGYVIESNKFLISGPCVLVSKLNPRKPRVSVVKSTQSALPHCASTEFMVYVPRADHVNLEFYGWYLSSLEFQRRLESVATGTTNSHVRARPAETLSWKVPLPPLPEQRRIAACIDSADEAIQETEALISNLKQAKTGLMHDLLRRGIDDHGHLRDPEANPEQFKDSPLGWIPKEWSVETLKQLSLNAGDYGSGAAALPFNQTLPRYVRITDIRSDGRLDSQSRASIRRNNAEGYYLQRNDLAFARSGATVGKTYLYDPADGECVYAGYVIKFSLDVKRCDPHFVSQWTRSSEYWTWVKRTLRQGAQPNINAQEYGSLLLPQPELKEQHRIAEILAAHDERIRAEGAYRDKLVLQKRGLIDDLLTGRVRVSDGGQGSST